MVKIELPPTKSSLRKIKGDLVLAHDSLDLLKQKREILAAEILGKVSEIKKIDLGFPDVLHELYASYRDAAVDMGIQAVTLRSCSERKAYTLNLQTTKLMGLKLPRMALTLMPFEPPGGMAGTSATYDLARERSRRALVALVVYATVIREVITLTRELKKLQRRVNAVEKIFIPPRNDAMKYITDRIEEMERDEVFVKKLIRQRASKRTASHRIG